MIENTDPFNDPIIIQNTRILRPVEYKKLKAAIPKTDYKMMLDSLMASGMRFAEFKIFENNPLWLNSNEKKIYLPAVAVRKKKIKRKQRWIKLSDWGADQIAAFLKINKTIPERRTWYDNMRRWAIIAGISDYGMNIKVTRKTWECWLIEYYGNIRGEDNITDILLSQGHTRETAINHYLSQPFTKKDRDDMTYMVEGWLGTNK